MKNGSEGFDIGSSSLAVKPFAPTLWVTATFAPDWFADAIKEAAVAGDGPRRREILFAVCCAESYLLEWTRDEALSRDFGRLSRYFPHGIQGGVDRKWKEVPAALHRNKVIPQKPDLGGSHGEDWSRLLACRDGLVHARSSRPATDSVPGAPNPVPTREELLKIPAGWAVRVVIERIKRLHAAVNTRTPVWLVAP
jgi:hypothetical protein